jgi:hemerythrin superfamily protein
MTTTKQQDVVDVLLAQHERIKELFGQVMAAGGGQKRELFEDLVRLLAVHEAAEEEFVHPQSRRGGAAGDAVVNALLDEERQAKGDLAEVYQIGTGGEGFDAALERLRVTVLEHAEHEEHEEFPALRAAVPDKRLTRWARLVLDAEKLAPTRPHTHAPSSEGGNMIAGPPMAVFDRIRDAVRDRREDDRG